jgi:hypothetical protein
MPISATPDVDSTLIADSDDMSLNTDFISGNRLSFDNNGNIYVTGQFMGPFEIGNVIIGKNTSSNGNLYVAKANRSGQFEWSRKIETQLNIPENYYPNVNTTADGISYVNFFFTDKAKFFDCNSDVVLFQRGNSGIDLAIAKIDSCGNWIDSTLVCGLIENRAESVSVSFSDREVYVWGSIRLSGGVIDSRLSRLNF